MCSFCTCECDCLFAFPQKEATPIEKRANMAQFACPVTEETYSEAGKEVVPVDYKAV